MAQINNNGSILRKIAQQKVRNIFHHHLKSIKSLFHKILVNFVT